MTYLRTIGLAHREWQDNNIYRAQTLLDSCEPELRNWEWHYIDRLLHCELQVFRAHQSGVRLVRFSSDGSRVISAGFDPIVRVWDVQSGREIQTFFPPEHVERIQALAITPDVTRLACAGDKGRIWIWDVASGKTPAALRYSALRDGLGISEKPVGGVEARIRRLAISPDGKTLITIATDWLAVFWDLDSGQMRGLIGDAENKLRDAYWSPDGRRLATIGIGGKAFIWDPATMAQVCSLPCEDDAVMGPL